MGTNTNQEITDALNVTTISTDPHIRVIFHFPCWTTEEGIYFLAGIFDEQEDADGLCHLTTLAGVKYSEPEDSEIIAAFIDRYVLLSKIWTRGHSKQKYSREKFVRWALRYQDICRTSWLQDAQNKQLIPLGWSQPTTNKIAESKTPESEPTYGERRSMLKIIAALALCGYKYPARGSHADMLKDFEANDVGVTDTTLRKYLKAAEQYLPPNHRQT